MSPDVAPRGLVAACREEPLAEKWVVGSSRRVAEQWLAAVTRGGLALLNAWPTSVVRMARELAAPLMVARGLRFVGPAELEELVRRAFGELQRGGGYFARLGAGSKLSQALLRSIGDMRLAGLTSSRIDVRQAFDVADKGRDLCRLLDTFEDTLRAAGGVDAADVLRLAIERLERDREAIPLHRLVLVDREVLLPGLRRAVGGRRGPRGAAPVHRR